MSINATPTTCDRLRSFFGIGIERPLSETQDANFNQARDQELEAAHARIRELESRLLSNSQHRLDTPLDSTESNTRIPNTSGIGTSSSSLQPTHVYQAQQQVSSRTISRDCLSKKILDFMKKSALYSIKVFSFLESIDVYKNRHLLTKPLLDTAINSSLDNEINNKLTNINRGFLVFVKTSIKNGNLRYNQFRNSAQLGDVTFWSSYLNGYLNGIENDRNHEEIAELREFFDEILSRMGSIITDRMITNVIREEFGIGGSQETGSLDECLEEIRQSFTCTVRAPLTLIRSEKPSRLNLTIIFNKEFRPQQPIFPSPSLKKTSEYTWKILANTDGTLTVSNQEGKTDIVKMIWWEASRTISNAPKNKISTCITRDEVYSFLKTALKIQTIKDHESEAFSAYWQSAIKNEYPYAPYVRIYWIPPEEHCKYIPSLEIKGEDANHFEIFREYFLFNPTSQKNVNDLEKENFFEKRSTRHLSNNVVIDLGGEFLDKNSKEHQKDFSKRDFDIFNSNFIKEHIQV